MLFESMNSKSVIDLVLSAHLSSNRNDRKYDGNADGGNLNAASQTADLFKCTEFALLLSLLSMLL